MWPLLRPNTFASIDLTKNVRLCLGWPMLASSGQSKFGVGWLGQVGVGVGLVWVGQICKSLGAIVFGRQVWIESGTPSTQSRLKVDPKGRPKVDSRSIQRSTEGRPKASQTSTQRRTLGQRNVDQTPTNARPRSTRSPKP